MSNRHWLWIVLVLLMACGPLIVGVAASPCDGFGDPILLSPYQVRRLDYLDEVLAWGEAEDEFLARLGEALTEPPPVSTGENFARAEAMGQLRARMEAHEIPQAPAAYVSLQDQMEALHDLAISATEQMLAYYGDGESEHLTEAQANLAEARRGLDDLLEGVQALKPRPCREVWRRGG